VLLARREEPLRSVADEVGGDAEVCNVADRAEVDRVASSVLARHPRVGVLVNNAGVPGRSPFLDAQPEQIEHVLRVNYLGSVWCLRAFLPGLEAAAPSDLVNVVSIAGLVAVAPSGPYSASKHAQAAFSRAVAGELAPRGVRVHTVFPGFVETEGFPQRSRGRGRMFERLVAEPEQVAEAIVDAVERGRRERFVPRWYRLPALAQALAPGLMSRALARRAYRKA
jgi:short-subunit dehydrogenase